MSMPNVHIGPHPANPYEADPHLYVWATGQWWTISIDKLVTHLLDGVDYPDTRTELTQSLLNGHPTD